MVRFHMDGKNIEINPAGVTLTCIGAGRPDRKRLDITGEGVTVETLIRPLQGWELQLYVPYSFMKKHFSKVENIFLGNFYKCGDLTDHQHYASWTKVGTESPDFHRPEFFGCLIVSE